MKTPILRTSVLTAIVSLALLSCNNSPKAKEDNLNAAKDEVEDAREDLVQTTSDSINDFNKYKNSIQMKLDENEKVIADLKANSKNMPDQAMYYKQLDDLKLKNLELKAKIENYQQGPEQKWELFKVDFNKEMDNLGKSISNAADRNMKK
jgi:hypothetical protein